MATVSEKDGCAGCPMRRLFPNNNFVELQLGTSTRIAILEAPGEQESIECRPTCGPTGKWLEGLYRKAGVKKDDVTIINTINCRPPNNVFPDDDKARAYISKQDARRAIGQCILNYVLPALEGRAWTRVDLFGAKALYYIANKVGIFTWRGSPVEIDTDDVRTRAEALKRA